MSDSTRRALRTIYQGLLALIVIVPLLAEALPTPTPRVAGIVAGTVAAVAVAAKLLNALEDAGYIPAFLKAPASDGANPVPDDAGHILVALLLIMGGAVLALVGLAGALSGGVQLLEVAFLLVGLALVALGIQRAT